MVYVMAFLCVLWNVLVFCGECVVVSVLWVVAW